jgi:hypothetical protein
MTAAKPTGYEGDLSDYGPIAYDASCGEPISWGFRILRHLGEERFRALGQYGELDCVGGKTWVLVIRRLTRDEAITLYGPITEEKRGPLGGWKSTTFGNKQFISRSMKPR